MADKPPRHLALVPPAEPDPVEQVRQRLRRMRPDGALSCKRCGGGTAITVVTGAYIHKGRVTGGTVTAKYECGHCWRDGIHVPMLPELEPVKK